MQEDMLLPRVFVSYSRQNSGFVKKLVANLAKHRILVWWDEWEIKVGDSLFDKIQEGIKNSSNLVVILSKDSVISSWVKEELNMALINQLQKQEIFVLPIVIEDCEIPLVLQNRLYADFRDDFDNGFQKLLNAIKRPATGQRGRLNEGEYHSDYRFEFANSDDRFQVKLHINHHGPEIPFSISCLAVMTANPTYSMRLKSMQEAGLLWAAYEMVLQAAFEAAQYLEEPLLIEGDKGLQVKFVNADPKREFATEITFEANRLGLDPGQDILFNWRTIFLGCIELHREKLKGLLTEQENDKFKNWLKENPA